MGEPVKPAVEHGRWQCSGCLRVYLTAWQQTCPGCGRRDYWSGSVDPEALAQARARAELTSTPNPGSAEAVALGCECPVLDNAHGQGCGLLDGEGKPLFWRSYECELHGSEPGSGMGDVAALSGGEHA